MACLYAWRLAASNSLGALLSSKVNQWTLLIGTIPVVFALFWGTTDGLPLATQQRLELLLTAAQSLFSDGAGGSSNATSTTWPPAAL